MNCTVHLWTFTFVYLDALDLLHRNSYTNRSKNGIYFFYVQNEIRVLSLHKLRFKTWSTVIFIFFLCIYVYSLLYFNIKIFLLTDLFLLMHCFPQNKVWLYWILVFYDFDDRWTTLISVFYIPSSNFIKSAIAMMNFMIKGTFGSSYLPMLIMICIQKPAVFW